MELTDALTVTALGMAVVFSGLLLTAGLIVAFGRLQSLFDAAPDGQTGATSADETAIAEPTGAETGPAVDPEVLTVIATVLEVEHRLHRVAQRPGTST
jgi:Na+-transporting methylmalonyl-CoA/oxaloacetate decarboxylase gamma subunit